MEANKIRHTWPWLLAGFLVLAALIAAPVRDSILLQNEAGATIPFLLYFFFSLAPAGQALLLRTRWAASAWVARARAVWPESVAWATLFFIIMIETLLDPTLTRWLGYDLTPAVHAFEGDRVAALQASLRPGPLGGFLDVVGSAVYSYGYAFVYAMVLGVALLRGDRALARPLLLAFLNVWMVGIPAFLFLPVNEPWYGSETVVNVLHTTLPPSADNPFLAYSLNNELPSLHSALSVACAYVLVRERRWRWFAAAALPALSLPFFVVYLGIHWVVDAVTGVLLGILAGWLATRPIGGRGKPEIPPTPSGAPNGGPST